MWATASALGVAAVLAASATVFTALKLLGAVYLVYLGIQALRATRHTDAEIESEPPRRGSSFRQGLVTNLLNPKLAVLFTTLLPQFISADDPPVAKSALLAAVFVSIGLTWLVTYVHIVRLLARTRMFKRGAEAVAGVVLIGLGVRLAVNR